MPSSLTLPPHMVPRSLTDVSAYVRRTGVMGILKLFHLAPDMVKSSNMVDLLYNMIQDPDLQVRLARGWGKGLGESSGAGRVRLGQQGGGWFAGVSIEDCPTTPAACVGSRA